MHSAAHNTIAHTLRQACAEMAGRLKPGPRAEPAEELGKLYESLIDRALPRRSGRRSTGCFYTPAALVDQVLDAALTPLLQRVQAPRDLLRLKICDPACGSGRFLVAVARLLAGRLVELRGGARSTAIRDVIGHCIYGVDLDPIAVDLTRFALWYELNDPGVPQTFISEHIRHGDSLIGTSTAQIARGIPAAAFEPHTDDDRAICTLLRKKNRAALPLPRFTNPAALDRYCSAFFWQRDNSPHGRNCPTNETLTGPLSAKLAKQVQRLRESHAFFHWPREFPEVFDGCGGFDAMIGNPPFRNMIDGGVSPRVKQFLAAQSALLTGTADTAFHFVRLAHQLTRPDGVVGFVLPKTFLNAPAARALRSELWQARKPSAILVPPADDQFHGASAYVCAVVLSGEAPCRVSLDNRERLLAWPTEIDAESEANWWRVISAPPVANGPAHRRLGDCFDVAAGMTTGEAYLIRDHLTDEERGKAARLITSRLIDPGECRWGRTDCRYLGQTLRYPRLAPQSSFPRSLQRRFANSCRPKLLLAGLCRHFEAYVDEQGRDLGAVSTFAIFHPRDDRQALHDLCRWLHSAEANSWLRDELGAASVGNGYMTVKKQTLRQLPLPAEFGQIAA